MATLPDVVRALVLESPAEGGTQLNTWPTELDPSQDALTAAGLYVQNARNSATDKSTLISRGTGGLTFTDALATRVLSELVTATRGQSSYHGALADVVHYLAEGPGDAFASGAVAVDTYSGLLRTATTWYTDASQTKAILAMAWTYSGLLVATERLSLLAPDGVTVVRQVTDTYSYSGAVRTQRVRTWT